MGSLLLEEDPGDCTPRFEQASILRLYKKELQILKNDAKFLELQKLFQEFKHTGYAKISLLIIGKSPENSTFSPIIR
jgi:hypothetical protein